MIAARLSLCLYYQIEFLKVGKQTMEDSKDQILKKEMPLAFSRVEESSVMLVGATQIFKNDPTSPEGRKKLLDGARGNKNGAY